MDTSTPINSRKHAPRVHASVHRTLRKQGTVNIILTMQESTEKALNAAKEGSFATREGKIASLVDGLEQLAAQSQQQVTALLSREAGSQTPLFSKTTSLWITNQVYIEGATFELVEKLVQLDSITEIREEEVFSIETSLSGSVDATGSGNATVISAEATPTWSVKVIQAPEVWAKGNTGQNIVVGVIDTGVRGTHEALRDNFRGAYGWLDPELHSAQPYDNAGHGTHVTGSAVGGKGIGVAPGAKWMACKACRTDACLESEMLACTQFMLCPTDTNGANKDCSKAPHVVNNSWSASSRGNAKYQTVVDAWRSAGIIPVVASSNVSPACSTVESPADYANVIAVGATNADDSLLFFSAVGPSLSGLLKPEVTAPGGAVYSASSTSDSAYKLDSGTSMASPHVAGTIALL
ncbi:hypothetical protein Gpo141_00014619, partial [Globisporangium polare]